ncbi:MAG: relaxase/mobilization nuclease domain-containing protein [Bifidobacterium choerinum]
MAVVKLGPKIMSTLHKAIRYIINPDKTQGGHLVSANYGHAGDDYHTLAAAMTHDLEATPGGNGPGMRKAYHVIQSFNPNDEITPEQVHELGVRLAEEITGGEYRYVVATHTDKDHLHNHIIICAANAVTHRKMDLPKDAIDQWRAISDTMCREHGLNVLPEAPATPMRQADKVDARRGMSMAELHAMAKGHGLKDTIRTLVNLTAATSKDWADLKHRLAEQGVDLGTRGRHVTYTWQPTGFRIRDDKLGAAYDMTSIMARIGHAAVTPITFNSRLIARKDLTAGTVEVWLPGSKRQLKTVIPLERIVVTGSTWRAFLADRHEQVITNRHGDYVDKIRSQGLYEWFGRPDTSTRIDRTEQRIIDNVQAGRSIGQRRYYAAIGRRVDRINEHAKDLTVLMQARRDGQDITRTMRDLRTRIRDEKAALQAAVVALADAIETGETDTVVEAKDEMTQREQRLDTLEHDLDTLTRAVNTLRQATAPDPPQDRTREQRDRQTAETEQARRERNTQTKRPGKRTAR